jgi:hypothetical protein
VLDPDLEDGILVTVIATGFVNEWHTVDIWYHNCLWR